MMKLSDITGHLVTLGLAASWLLRSEPTPDASALNDQPKAAPQAEATPVTEQYTRRVRPTWTRPSSSSATSACSSSSTRPR